MYKHRASEQKWVKKKHSELLEQPRPVANGGSSDPGLTTGLTENGEGVCFRRRGLQALPHIFNSILDLAGNQRREADMGEMSLSELQLQHFRSTEGVSEFLGQPDMKMIQMKLCLNILTLKLKLKLEQS